MDNYQYPLSDHITWGVSVLFFIGVEEMGLSEMGALLLLPSLALSAIDFLFIHSSSTSAGRFLWSMGLALVSAFLFRVIAGAFWSLSFWGKVIRCFLISVVAAGLVCLLWDFKKNPRIDPSGGAVLFMIVPLMIMYGGRK